MANGFAEIPHEKLKEILVQFTIDGFGTTEELDKLHSLEEELDQAIGWLGLGHCDGNSIGSDTMEVCCFVVDADIAIKCIKKSLKGTRYADGATIRMVDRGEEDDEE
jgi:hypothetical protein